MRGGVKGQGPCKLAASPKIPGGGGELMEFAVATGCGRKADLARLVGVSLIRFRTTDASPIILTSSESESRSAGRLGVFRGVAGAVRSIETKTSSSLPVKSRSRRGSEVLGSRVVRRKGRSGEGGGGGGAEMMSAFLPVPEAPSAAEWPVTGGSRAVSARALNAVFGFDASAGIFVGPIKEAFTLARKNKRKRDPVGVRKGRNGQALIGYFTDI